MEKLFAEFKGVTTQQWKEQIIKDLKGIDFNSLIWKTENGFDISPIYTSEDLKEKNTPLFSDSEWDLVEFIDVTDEDSANTKALNALKRGASGLIFNIHKKVNTEKLIKGISLEHIYSEFNISNDALHLINDLKEHYGHKNAFDGKIKCIINIDPLYLLAHYGEWHENEKSDLEVLKKLQHISVNATLYQEAGSSIVNELAFALAHLNEYFNYLSHEKFASFKLIHASFSIGGDFFMEIAKLRAFRKLVSFLQKQYNTNCQLHIHCQTSGINKSKADAYNNMLRSTTEAMSAIIGGSNSLVVMPYNSTFEEKDDFSSRIALNQQHILKDESYLNKVADIAAGSYYVENLTELLAEKVWEKFKEIENKGGYIKCLQNNFIQNEIEKDFNTAVTHYKENKLVLVGVNKFQNATEKIIETKAKQEKTKGPLITRILPRNYSESLI